MTNTNLEAGLRPLSNYAKLSVESSVIEDRYVKSDLFPNIFIGENFKLEIDQFPHYNIRADVRGLQLFANFDTIMKIANEFQTKTGEEFDFGPYLESAEAKTQELAAKGQEFVAEFLKTGLPTPIQFDVSIKAPQVYVPRNLKTLDEGMMVIDMGQFTAGTSKEKYGDLDYDKYTFDLDDIQILMV